MRTRLFDLPGGFVEQRSALGCGAVEVREHLAVLPLQDDRLAACRWTRLEAAETIVDVREPVAALGVFAFVDHVDAGLALTRDDVGNHLAQIGVVFAAWPIGAVWARQAADMGRENLFCSCFAASSFLWLRLPVSKFARTTPVHASRRR